MEEGEGEEERGEGVGIGFGRGVDESDNWCAPAKGGVEQGGGEDEQEGAIGIGLGRGGWENIGVGDECVGEGVAEESGVCFGGEEDGKEGMLAAVGVGMEAV